MFVCFGQTIGDVRGKGLMIGIDMVEDKASKKPLSMERFMPVSSKIEREREREKERD